MSNYFPRIDDWEFFFDRKSGYENRLIVMANFLEFWEDPSATFHKVFGNVIISGRVYGRIGIPEGRKIYTSNVRSIERIGVECTESYAREIYEITTASNKYYLYSDKCTDGMLDLMTISELEVKRWNRIKSDNLSVKLI